MGEYCTACSEDCLLLLGDASEALDRLVALCCRGWNAWLEVLERGDVKAAVLTRGLWCGCGHSTLPKPATDALGFFRTGLWSQ